MRADRLVAIVLLLQAHGQLTAGRLAELLETSERTVRRDLDALCVAGVPVYSQRGRGGGWALLGGHRLDLTGLTVQEAQALFLAAGADAGRSGGIEPGLKSALRKVFAALPEPLRVQAEAATQAVVVDPVGWWGRAPGDEPPALGPLRAAVLARVQVDLDYAKPRQQPVRRRVHPYGLVAKGGVWYLLAGTAKGRRTYRVSRVGEVRLTDEPAVRPDDFDLAGEWSSAQADFAAQLEASGITVEVEVTERASRWLLGTFRDHAREVEAPAAAPGWRRFTLSVPYLRMAAARLAPFGGELRVRSPDGLRHELARLGLELLAAHGAAEGQLASV